MAEEFFFWLEERLFEEFTEEQRKSTMVISVVGKEVADNTKADLLNQFLGKQVFFDRWYSDSKSRREEERAKSRESHTEMFEADATKSSSLEISIDVYFDPDESLLLLLLNGANDVGIQHLMFNNDRYKGKSFFEKMAAMEQQQIRLLSMLFHISHAILFVEQACRFDLDCITTLKQLNKLRPRIYKRIRQSLSLVPESELASKFPKNMVDYGRLATPPRLLFCFYRNPLRSDLNPIKKKELLEKMEKCLEGQIANLLKQHGLVDNRRPNTDLCQITITSGVPFVYCFNQSEHPIDKNHELAMALFGPPNPMQQQQPFVGSDDGNSSVGSKTTTHTAIGIGGGGGGGAGGFWATNAEETQQIIDQIIGPPKPLDKEKLNPGDYNFAYFLNQALKNMQKGGGVGGGRKYGRDGGTTTIEFELPTLDQFVEMAKIVEKCLEEEWAEEGQQQMTIKLMSELATIQSIIDSVLCSANAIYTRQLALQSEITGGGDPVFSSIEHEYTLKIAQDYLEKYCPRAVGTAKRANMMERLKEKCQIIWENGHRRCEQRSLTGQLCHFMINHEQREKTDGEELIDFRDRSGSGSGRGRSGSGRWNKQHRQQSSHEGVPAIINSRQQQHCSGVKTFGMCDCGMSRCIRVDPFTLKEANFDFYYTKNSDFSFATCCAKLDKYEFKLFDPSTAHQQNLNQHEEEDQKTAKATTETIEEPVRRLFEMLKPTDGMAAKGKESHSTTKPLDHHLDEELAGFGMDPSEFNVRFFDDNDDGHEQEEEEAAVDDGNAELAMDKREPTNEDGKMEGTKGGITSTQKTEAKADEEAEEEEEEEKADGAEKTRRKNILAENSTDEEEEDDEEEEEEDEEEDEGRHAPAPKEEEGRKRDEQRDEEEEEAESSRPSTLPPSSSGSPEPGHYLDEYDSHLTRAITTAAIGESDVAMASRTAGGGGNEAKGRGGKMPKDKLQQQKFDINDPKVVEKFKGQFLEHVPHTASPSPQMLPLFPSFAVVCLGHSSVYNHSTGIRCPEGSAKFRNGSEFLFPWSVDLVVNTEQWIRELQYIGVTPGDRTIRNLQNGRARGRAESREKVKLFIGFDYECPRGHRFTVSEPGKPLRHRKAAGQLKQDGGQLMETDMPIWMPCPCKKEPRTTAQLMRIHVVTPKAPVSVVLAPMIEIPSVDDPAGFFYPGPMERIELGWAKYYVCRLPYAYVGPSGQPIYRPTNPEFLGRLIRKCVSVAHLPIE